MSDRFQNNSVLENGSGDIHSSLEKSSVSEEAARMRSSTERVELKQVEVVYTGESFLVQIIRKFVVGVRDQIRKHFKSVTLKSKSLKSSPQALLQVCSQLVATVMQTTTLPSAGGGVSPVAMVDGGDGGS